MQKKKQKESEIRKKINEFYEENELAHLESNKNRARSFTVGTAFGGIIELSMRGDFHSLWCLLQPVEAVEFIEQLAAAAGLQVALRPKQDFSSWRGWNVDAEDKYWIGSAQWQIRANDANEQKALKEAETQKELPESKENKKITIKTKRKKNETIINDSDIDVNE